MPQLRNVVFICAVLSARLTLAADAAYIRSQLNPDTCVTLLDGAKDGSRIGLEKCAKLRPITVFRLEGSHLAVGDWCVGSADDGKSLITTACDSGKALVIKPDGVRLKVGDGARCIYDMSENGTSHDALRLESCNRGRGLNWIFPASVPTEGFQVQINGEGQCLCDIDPHDGGTRVRTEFCVDDYGPTAKWQFKRGRLVSQGRCLGSDDGSNLSLRDCAKAGVITWGSTKAGQLQANGGNCLDVGWANKKTQMNTPVVLRPCDGNAHQNWSFPAEELSASLKDAPAPTPTTAVSPPPATTPAPAPTTAVSPPPATTPAGCPEATMASILTAVEEKSFNEDKVKAVGATMGSCHFSVQQVGRIIDAFDFPQDRITVIKKLRPVIVDPANGAALLTHFDFVSDKEAVTKIMK